MTVWEREQAKEAVRVSELRELAALLSSPCICCGGGNVHDIQDCHYFECGDCRAHLQYHTIEEITRSVRYYNREAASNEQQ